MVAPRRTNPATKNLSRFPTKSAKLNPEDKFWKEVEEKSKSLIANLIEKTLPISATPNALDLEKDADYRILLREVLPNSYADQEELQEKIANESWTEADVEYISQDLTATYFDLVVKSLVVWLNEYPAFESTDLSQRFSE